MYSSDDMYEQILEDVGNLRTLSNDQFRYLCEQDKHRIVAVLYAMNKTLDTFVGSLTPMHASWLHSCNERTNDICRKVSDGIKSSEKCTSVGLNENLETMFSKPVRKFSSQRTLTMFQTCTQS